MVVSLRAFYNKDDPNNCIGRKIIKQGQGLDLQQFDDAGLDGEGGFVEPSVTFSMQTTRVVASMRKE